MIRINLLSERKQPKASSGASLKAEGAGASRQLLLVGLLIVGVVVAGGWWWKLASEEAEWKRKHVEADKELARLEEIRKKGDEYKRQKELLSRKINLITELKKMQAVPVHILDQVSKNLPDFVWLDSMTAAKNQIRINGKATTYNAVSTFYNNLTGSGYFADVELGRTLEVKEGVSFSMTCRFATGPSEGEEEEPAEEETQG